ncbi:Uu.00g026840.m01.CDS01 [Anthostomella pinea]|uniref:RNA-directed DNA polymerase n=1 Tax=Anthostomella pinea TaxID=933095 RepID=A0AAI8YCJ6_9PEZI|nr:Uu.00g026840.m01.CDS01 [Anthostomella pinea]
MATNTNGNFGQSGDETLMLKSCVERNCDGNFRPFHNALSNDSGNNLQANTQALVIFNALEKALSLQEAKIAQLQQTVTTGTGEFQALRDQLKKKVNNELQSAVISVFPKPQNEDFDGWVECYRSLTENIADYAHHTGNKNLFANNNPFNNNSNKNNNKDGNNKNNQMPQHPPRAQNPAPAAETVEKGLCLYCGGEGHMKRDCPEAPQLLQSATPARGGGFTLTRPGSALPDGNLQGSGSNNTNPFRQGHASDLRIRAIGWRGNADDWPGSTTSTPGYNNGYGQQYGHEGNGDQPSRESKGQVLRKVAPRTLTTKMFQIWMCCTSNQRTRAGILSYCVQPSVKVAAARNNVTEFVTVTMEVDGHLETLLCFLTELGNENPLILGFPWLQTHNPSIDWQTCEITFCSDFCRNNCFHVRPVQVRGGRKAPNPNQHKKKVQFAETEPLRDCSPDDLKISSAVSFAWFCRQKGVTISRITVKQLEQASLPELKPPELSEHDIRQILTTEGSTEEHKAKLDTRYHVFMDDIFDKHFLNRVTDKDIKKYLKDKEPATFNNIKKKLPPEYHDLIDVFLPFGATTLPEHRSYDHHIDIEPGKSIPNLKTRPISQSELRVMKKYLDNNMQKKEHVCKVLEALRAANLHIDIGKCEFHTTKTKYLGLIISTDGISMDPEKRFLGFANFYRQFIRGFSLITRPLTGRLKTSERWDWTRDCQTAFQSLKESFTRAVVLSYFHPARQTMIETDASDWAAGGVVSQYDDDGNLHPIGFYSAKHTPAEANYEIYDKELLAIIKALKKWRPELQGTDEPFEIITDHKNLQYFMTTKLLTQRQARWAEFLSQFNFQIVYRSGKQSVKPDALSRRPGDSPMKFDTTNSRVAARQQTILPASRISPGMDQQDEEYLCVLDTSEDLDDLIDIAYSTDPMTKKVVRALLIQRSWPKTVKRFIQVPFGDCELRDGRVFYRNKLFILENDHLRLQIEYYRKKEALEQRDWHKRREESESESSDDSDTDSDENSTESDDTTDYDV